MKIAFLEILPHLLDYHTQHFKQISRHLQYQHLKTDSIPQAECTIIEINTVNVILARSFIFGLLSINISSIPRAQYEVLVVLTNFLSHAARILVMFITVGVEICMHVHTDDRAGDCKSRGVHLCHDTERLFSHTALSTVFSIST